MLYPIKRITTANFGSRNGYKPLIIVNHITDGEDVVRRDDAHEESAVRNTFCSPSESASATFVIQRDGDIEQYVDIQNAPWTNGLHSAEDYLASKSPIVRQMRVNPNWYSVTKEYIGYAGHGGDGSITEEQFWAGVWLDKWIQTEVMRIYNYKIPLNSTYEMGHCHVAPGWKPHCPGRNFPWTRIYTELAIADSMSLADYEGRIRMVRSPNLQQNHSFDIANEVLYLYNLSQQPTGEGEWAKGVLLRLHPVMTSLGLLTKPYDEKTSAADVYNQALYMYNLGKGTDGNAEWAKNELLKMYPFMLQNGLVPAS